MADSTGGFSTTLSSLSGLPWNTVLANLSASSGGVLQLVQTVAYCLGILFFITGILMAAKSANPAARAEHGKSGWFWSMVISAAMMSLPSTIASFTVTLFGASNDPTSYMQLQTSGSGPLAPLVPLLAVFGLIAVIRGLMVWRTVGMYGNYSKGNATFGRGLVLVISGCLLCNLQPTLGIASSVTGLNVGAGLF
jgi:hypothetical protein